MRLVAPTLALLVWIAPAVGAAPADPAAACQRQVARAAAKFTRAALKIGQRCAVRAARGGLMCHIAPDASSGDRGTDAALARASGRLAGQVGDACRNADVDEFARRCPDPTGPPLIWPELVKCLLDTHLARVGAMLAVEFPAPATATAGVEECTAPETCQCRCASPSGAFVTDAGSDRL